MALSDKSRQDLEEALEAATTSLALYNQQLAKDALNPLGSYHLDGESVDRDKWRRGIMQVKKDLTEEIRQIQLLLSRPIGLTWLGKPVSEQLPYEQRD